MASPRLLIDVGHELTAGRRVVVAGGGTLDYDYLILAIGVTAAFFGIPGAAEHSWSLYTRRDAVALRNRLAASLERLSVAGPGPGLAVTIVGGGATGVELAGTACWPPAPTFGSTGRTGGSDRKSVV